jgi:hypothetical protein
MFFLPIYLHGEVNTIVTNWTLLFFKDELKVMLYSSVGTPALIIIVIIFIIISHIISHSLP